MKTILDATTPGERICALTGEKWMMTEEEIGWYKKFNVPPSKYSPLAQITITASFATGFGWWWQKHPETGKPVLTYVHPAKGIKALPDAEFFEKDQTEKGRAYDPSKPFMDQMHVLQLDVPFTASRSLIPTHNSVALLSQGDENSYFVTASRSKNSFYLYSSLDVEKSAEVYESSAVNQSYNVLNSHRIFKCKFVRQSYDCMESAFLFDCRNCEYCFGASGKRNRKYVWWNEQLSKGEWEKRRATADLSSRSTVEEMTKRFRDLVGHDAVWPENFNEHAEDCIGEYLHKCRNCRYLLFGEDGPHDNFWCAVFSANRSRMPLWVGPWIRRSATIRTRR